MKSSLLPRTLVATAIFLLLGTVPGVMAQGEPIILDALEAQEAAADILDTYERIFKRYDSSVFGELLPKINLARGVLFAAPFEELERMGELMGGDLLAMRQMSRQHTQVLLAPVDLGEVYFYTHVNSILSTGYSGIGERSD